MSGDSSSAADNPPAKGASSTGSTGFNAPPPPAAAARQQPTQFNPQAASFAPAAAGGAWPAAGAAQPQWQFMHGGFQPQLMHHGGPHPGMPEVGGGGAPPHLRTFPASGGGAVGPPQLVPVFAAANGQFRPMMMPPAQSSAQAAAVNLAVAAGAQAAHAQQQAFVAHAHQQQFLQQQRSGGPQINHQQPPPPAVSPIEHQMRAEAEYRARLAVAAHFGGAGAGVVGAPHAHPGSHSAHDSSVSDSSGQASNSYNEMLAMKSGMPNPLVATHQPKGNGFGPQGRPLHSDHPSPTNESKNIRRPGPDPATRKSQFVSTTKIIEDPHGAATSRGGQELGATARQFYLGAGQHGVAGTSSVAASTTVVPGAGGSGLGAVAATSMPPMKSWYSNQHGPQAPGHHLRMKEQSPFGANAIPGTGRASSKEDGSGLVDVLGPVNLEHLYIFDEFDNLDEDELPEAAVAVVRKWKQVGMKKAKNLTSSPLQTADIRIGSSGNDNENANEKEAAARKAGSKTASETGKATSKHDHDSKHNGVKVNEPPLPSTASVASCSTASGAHGESAASTSTSANEATTSSASSSGSGSATHGAAAASSGSKTSSPAGETMTNHQLSAVDEVLDKEGAEQGGEEVDLRLEQLSDAEHLKLLSTIHEWFTKSGNKVFGFDMEWKPEQNLNSMKHLHGVALMQFAADDGKQVLLRTIHTSACGVELGDRPRRKLPQFLTRLFQDPEICLPVVGDCDKPRLESSFAVQVENMPDLREHFTKETGRKRGRSLEQMAEYYYGRDVLKGYKDKRIQTSNWSAEEELSAAQVRYAAKDAEMALRIYRTIEKRLEEHRKRAETEETSYQWGYQTTRKAAAETIQAEKASSNMGTVEDTKKAKTGTTAAANAGTARTSRQFQ
mmetsp:Transcript_6406/g.15834  ORF Transcript_6406/g.15834 Transcript_6406/m.15834 type:complete len:895 (+) Transcript_6406:155-2839(+)